MNVKLPSSLSFCASAPAQPWGGVQHLGVCNQHAESQGRRWTGQELCRCEQMGGAELGMRFAQLRAPFRRSIAGCVLEHEPALRILVAAGTGQLAQATGSALLQG